MSLHQNFGDLRRAGRRSRGGSLGRDLAKKIVAAVDCGIQINPDTIRAQIEGGVLFGLSAALFNGITFDEGRVQQGNFNDYRQLRINETPPIEVHLLDSGEAARRPRRGGNGVCGPGAREARSSQRPASASAACRSIGRCFRRRRDDPMKRYLVADGPAAAGLAGAAAFFFWPAGLDPVAPSPKRSQRAKRCSRAANI